MREGEVEELVAGKGAETVAGEVVGIEGRKDNQKKGGSFRWQKLKEIRLWNRYKRT